MKVTVAKSPKHKTVVHFVTKESAKSILDFEGGKGETAVRYQNDQTVVYGGLGEKKKCDANVIRSTAANAIKVVMKLKKKKVSVIGPECNSSGADCWTAALEGVVLGTYTFDKFKSEKSEPLNEIQLVAQKATQTKAEKTVAICESVFYARDLINENAHEIVPERLAKEARKLANRTPIKTTVLTEKEIKEKGMGLLWAVGQGSPFPPRLIFMEYKGNPKSKKTVAIVGKGITFDSGGQNLKPSGHVETMRSDMSGAAAVLGTMRAISIIKPKINVIGVVSSAHNAIGEGSYFPGDIYKSYSGKTVEIGNTDAEGRLVLADGIAYLVEKYAPNQIIDLATLTGGVLIALGDTIAGLFANDDSMAQKLFDCGEKTGERLWRLPLYEEHADLMKSDIADLRNISKGKRGHASSITGAAFIQQFVGDTPWAHIDIAGTAFNDGEAKGEVPKFGVGFGVRLLWDYLTA